MATGKSGLSSVEFRTPQHTLVPQDSDQPAAIDSKLLPGQLRCCAVEQVTYLHGVPSREFFSSKDATKRKRINRIAKLKQCKLDARREQWLSQGSRCRPEQDKEDAELLTRNEEKQGPVENTEVGEVASAEKAEYRVHGVVGSAFVNEEIISTKQNEVSCFPTPLMVGSVKSHSKMMQTLNVGENARPQLLLRASQDDVFQNKRRPTDPGWTPIESEEALGGILQHQFCSETSGNGRCAATCYKSDLICFRTDDDPRNCESVVARLDLVSRIPKLHDGDAVDLSDKNGKRNGYRQDCGTNLFFRSCSPCTSNCTVEIGPAGDELPLSQETEDDWEVAADALYVPVSSSIIDASRFSDPPSESEESTEQKGRILGTANLQNGVLMPEYKYKAAGFGIKSRSVGGRAWRPDDVCRPPTLPRLSKQLSLPQESSTSAWSGLQHGRSVWGPPPIPSYCPICTEELDMTDSSFFPCSCGFRLCLFCHHRISSDDGRCPGCRKTYSPDVAMKLSRTSFWLSV